MLAIGLLPLSLLSLTPAITGSCPSGPALGLVMEGILVASLLLRPSAARTTWLGLSRQWPWRHRAILWAALAWSLAFAIWSTTWEAHSGVTPLLSNANPDLNAYIRRVAASLTENLHFDGVEACGYNWGSPKKLSSLLLALTVAPFPHPVQGITAFQGALAGAVLLVVFQDWLLQPFRDNGRPGNTARLLAAAWAITAPVPYWLAANSYLSQALFLILASVGYREMRRHQIQPHLYPESVWRLLLVALTTTTYSFYPAFLPLLILALLLTQVDYGLAMAEPWLRLCRQGGLTLLVPGLTVLLLVLTFTDQAELGEVSHSLNPMIGHASNFVPINPWSLLQESPKPMPNVRDFGWWFHLALGLPSSLLGGLLCWRFWRRQRQPDLFAAVMGIAAYGGYLLLFFPLESTYRLMKLKGTLLYPLAVCGALPLVFALRRWTIKQGPSTRLVLSLLAVFHIAFHVDVVADMGTWPGGIGFARTITLPQDLSVPIVVFACEKDPTVPWSHQYHERLVGLDLALRHPGRDIHVFSHSVDGIASALHTLRHPDTLAVPSGGLTIDGQLQRHTSGKRYCQYVP